MARKSAMQRDPGQGLQRLSPGVYRNSQGQLVNQGGRRLQPSARPQMQPNMNQVAGQNLGSMLGGGQNIGQQLGNQVGSDPYAVGQTMGNQMQGNQGATGDFVSYPLMSQGANLANAVAQNPGGYFGNSASQSAQGATRLPIGGTNMNVGQWGQMQPLPFRPSLMQNNTNQLNQMIADNQQLPQTAQDMMAKLTPDQIQQLKKMFGQF